MNGLPFGESPVDIEDHEAAGTEAEDGLDWSYRILGICTGLLLLFNGHALTNWSNQQPVNRLNAPLLEGIRQWEEFADALALNWPVNLGRSAWHSVQAARWHKQVADAGAQASAGAEAPDQPNN